mmetsp:Transcript_12936/g.23470  ORF Transcript_12936/g.23470 Transcript_12936/m.23470 type:complete len:251 (-) Transcript_12936:1655-2407(-)
MVARCSSFGLVSWSCFFRGLFGFLLEDLHLIRLLRSLFRALFGFGELLLPDDISRQELDGSELPNDGPFHPKHLRVRVLVAMRDLELLPRVPEVAIALRRAVLCSVLVDRPCPVDFAQLALERRVAQAHRLEVLLGQLPDGLVVDLPRLCDSEQIRDPANIYGIHRSSLFRIHSLASAGQHVHGAPGQSVIFLVFGIEQVHSSSIGLCDLADCLLEEVAGPLLLLALVAVDEALEVCDPYRKGMREMEEF